MIPPMLASSASNRSRSERWFARQRKDVFPDRASLTLRKQQALRKKAKVLARRKES